MFWLAVEDFHRFSVNRMMIAIFKHVDNGIYFIDVVLHHVLKKVKAVCV